MHKADARVVWYVIAAGFAFSGALVFTAVPIYFVNTIGLNPLQLLLVGTVLEATAFVFEVPTGVVADTYSRRLSVIVSFFIGGVSSLMIVAVPAYGMILAAYFVMGVGATFMSGAADAWIADEAGVEHLRDIYLRATQAGAAASLAGIVASVALANVRIELPVIVGGIVTLATGVYLVVAMPERGFRPSPRTERDNWGGMARTLAGGTRLVRGRSLLLTLLCVSAVFGMYSEGIDRLNEAHFLRGFSFPAVAGLGTVTWFGVIEGGGLILSFGVAEVARRRLRGDGSAAAARALFVITSLEVAGTLAFALAGNFAMALVAFWTAGVMRTMAGPIYRA